jgi:hypothetical protein
MCELPLLRELAHRPRALPDVRGIRMAPRKRPPAVGVGLSPMSLLNALLERFRPERRPPTGPLTTQESTTEALRVEQERVAETPRDEQEAAP